MAEFIIENILNLGNLVAVPGEVKDGMIREEDMGTTIDNKRFKIVRIQTKDGPIPRAEKGQQVTLVLKDITKRDLGRGDTLFIE